MTSPLSRHQSRRRSLSVLPLLLVPLLMTACTAAGGSSSPSAAEASGTAASSASAGAAASGDDLYEKYTTGAQLCALVPLPDVSKAMRVTPGYSKAKPVVVGDAAIDVFGVGSRDVEHEAALAAAFAQKVR